MALGHDTFQSPTGAARGFVCLVCVCIQKPYMALLKVHFSAFHGEGKSLSPPLPLFMHSPSGTSVLCLFHVKMSLRS